MQFTSCDLVALISKENDSFDHKSSNLMSLEALGEIRGLSDKDGGLGVCFDSFLADSGRYTV